MENTSQRHRELHREIKVIESHQPKVIITGGEEVKIKSDSMGPRGYVEFIRDRVWAVCLFGRSRVGIEVEAGVIGPIYPRNQSRTIVLLTTKMGKGTCRVESGSWFVYGDERRMEVAEAG